MVSFRVRHLRKDFVKPALEPLANLHSRLRGAERPSEDLSKDISDADWVLLDNLMPHVSTLDPPL